MLVQVYAVKTPEEACLCIECGVDRFGVVVGELGKTPDETNFEMTRRIFAATPPHYPKMALTVETDLEAIQEMVQATRPDILHLSGDITCLLPQGVAILRQNLPGIQIVQAIPVTGIKAIELSLAYENVCDICFLDTKDPRESVIGATGATHDWSISSEIVKRLKIPVILAGGLSPENVAEAINAVHPWGVDSNTHTNLPGTWKKDAERIRRFVEEAKKSL
jgi:phosphoribosylanthranilate isomerase